jgi:hypothetical protein
MRKWERELRRIPGVKGVEQTRGNHLRLLLNNDRFVITGLTTSDQRVIHHVISQVRRELRRAGNYYFRSTN